MDVVAALLVVLIGIAFVGAMAWYLLWLTEGMYLGRRVVTLLYDLYADRYDRTKNYDQTYETFFLARPVIQRMKRDGVRAPLVLDVATGTGRVPALLLEQDDFQGTVIGLDSSRKMLFHAAVKLHGFPRSRYGLVCQSADDLPFPDDTFDLVTCIEAWEFFPHAREDLRELVRVLRPGGTLMITNRTGADARAMPGKTLRTDDFRRWLSEALGLVDLQDERWQIDYDLFWGVKAGESRPAGIRPLPELIRCPGCHAADMIVVQSAEWLCGSCERRYRMGDDNVLELMDVK
jgi:ubiquinone/menaquinone biosynthesis C-methylase UbiE